MTNIKNLKFKASHQFLLKHCVTAQHCHWEPPSQTKLFLFLKIWNYPTFYHKMQKKKTFFARFRQIFDNTSEAKSFQSHNCCHQGSEQKQQPASHRLYKMKSEPVLKYVPLKSRHLISICKKIITIIIITITSIIAILGKGSNNQNGNLWWIFPWRWGGLEFHLRIMKNDFLKKHLLESFPDCESVFCT